MFVFTISYTNERPTHNLRWRRSETEVGSNKVAVGLEE